jgi:hypothetical protein
MKVYFYLNITEWNVTTAVTEHDFWKTHTDPSNPNLRVMDHSTMLLIETQEIDIRIPDYDPVTFKILALESKLTKDIADSYVRQTALKEKIQELKCIGHDVPVV